MLIRPATSLDLPQIAQLHAATFAEIRAMAPDGFGAALDQPLPVSQIAADFRDALDNSDSLVLAAEADGRILGFLSALKETHGDDMLPSPYMTIEYVEVVPAARGKGVARALVAEAERIACQRGLPAVEILVWEGNAAARGLCNGLGYTTLELRLAKLIEP